MTIDFWFDPTCPFTWRTSRWIRDVTARRGELVHWRLMSLGVLNEGKEVPEQYRARLEFGRRALRVLAATDQRHGQEAVVALYTAIGTRLHHEGAELGGIIADALAEAELPAELEQSTNDESLDEVVRASHEKGQASVGTESGSPVLSIDGAPAFFGPVLAPVPEGEEADRLFDAIALLARVPQFAELKRARNPV